MKIYILTIFFLKNSFAPLDKLSHLRMYIFVLLLIHLNIDLPIFESNMPSQEQLIAKKAQ